VYLVGFAQSQGYVDGNERTDSIAACSSSRSMALRCTAMVRRGAATYARGDHQAGDTDLAACFRARLS